MNGHHYRRALTLIEMLAVVVLLSLVAALGSVGLVSGNEQAQLRASLAAWQDLDATARLLAQTNGPIQMVLNEGTIAISSTHVGEGFSSVVLPDGYTGHLVVGNHETNAITFDARGHSEDYRVEIRRLATELPGSGWEVCGLTGWVVHREASP